MNPLSCYFHRDPEGDMMVAVGGSLNADWLTGFWSREQVLNLGDGRVSHGVPITWYDEDTDTYWIDALPSIE